MLSVTVNQPLSSANLAEQNLERKNDEKSLLQKVWYFVKHFFQVILGCFFLFGTPCLFSASLKPVEPISQQCTQFYFAYGSNLSDDFLKERLKDGTWSKDGWHKSGKLIGPPPIDLGVYMLSDYEFGYTLDLTTETAGNIVPKKKSTVYGVLYKISDSQLEELDKSEDVPRDYTRVAVKVNKVASNLFNTIEGNEIEAWVYVGNPKLVTCRINPDPTYVDLLVNSAIKRGCPQTYINQYLKVSQPSYIEEAKAVEAM